MKWTQYSLKTTTQATDMISYTLGELGVEGIEVEDHIPLTEDEKKQMFVDILPETAPDDGTAVIRFYRDPEENISEFMTLVNDALDELRSFMDIGEAKLEISETADKDWMNNWKEFFHTFRVSDKLIIKPTWEDKVDLEITRIAILLSILILAQHLVQVHMRQQDSVHWLLRNISKKATMFLMLDAEAVSFQLFP